MAKGLNKVMLIGALALSVALNVALLRRPPASIRPLILPPSGPWQCLDSTQGGIPYHVSCVSFEPGLMRGLTCEEQAGYSELVGYDVCGVHSEWTVRIIDGGN